MTDEKKTRSRSGKPEDIHPAARPFLWLEKPGTHFWILILLGVSALALLTIDFVHQRHEYLDWAGTPGFYAGFGFGGFIIAVLIAWALRQLLGRPGDYYDQEGDHD